MTNDEYIKKYGPGPYITADAVVTFGRFVALIQRRDSDDWALPGGFIDHAKNETLLACAVRELQEETGLRLDIAERPWFGFTVGDPVVFDAIDRDPRRRIITCAFHVKLHDKGSFPNLIAGSDAKEAVWFALDSLPYLYADHNWIISKVLRSSSENR